MSHDDHSLQQPFAGQIVPTGSTDGTGKPVTIFLCGPTRCEHDYSRIEDIVMDGRVCGATAVCSKCGAAAIDEAMWE